MGVTYDLCDRLDGINDTVTTTDSGSYTQILLYTHQSGRES